MKRAWNLSRMKKSVIFCLLVDFFFDKNINLVVFPFAFKETRSKKEKKKIEKTINLKFSSLIKAKKEIITTKTRTKAQNNTFNIVHRLKLFQTFGISVIVLNVFIAFDVIGFMA